MSETKKFPWKQYGTALIFYGLIAGALVLIAALLPGPIFNPKQDNPSNAALSQQQQVDARLKELYSQILTRVGQLAVLPNVIPQISVVENVESFIQQNPQFQGTSLGDIVLIYPDRVIIYSPKIDKIIHTAVLQPGQSNPTPIQAAPDTDKVNTESNDQQADKNN